jgi:hypothetical protein
MTEIVRESMVMDNHSDLGAAACCTGGLGHGPPGPAGEGLCSTPVGVGMEAKEGSWLSISQAVGLDSAQLDVARPNQQEARLFRWLWLPRTALFHP